ncbi:DUF192 domain-containing protein [Candidatus Nanosalina sp. VS9-1]|uniref:DUF192 domain-containing protein n=1 Tax=Candidatus Nanosalina sp. VS9-1 TaxID=3388566 RepID=UPI0039E0AEEE
MDQSLRQGLTVAILVVALGLIVTAPSPENDIKADGLENSSLVKAAFIDDDEKVAELKLETATTPEERARGLMGRESLDNDSGMIFIYDDARERSFWMKNTKIPLDMIFLTAERTVRTIKEADPEPNVSDEDLKSYTSEGPAKYVIETNQNFSDEKGIEEEMKVLLEPLDQ